MERLRAFECPDEADECSRREQSFSKAWEEIEAANTAGFLDDERIAQLREYGKLLCRDASGKEIRLLTDEELETVTVRKGTLTDDERRSMESHVTYTARMLSQMNFRGIYEDVPFWAGAHHELLNGAGYPKGLSGEDIPNEVRLLTILDIYDALTAEDRPYKPAIAPGKAFMILHDMASEGGLDGHLLGLFEKSGAWKQ